MSIEKCKVGRRHILLYSQLITAGKLDTNEKKRGRDEPVDAELQVRKKARRDYAASNCLRLDNRDRQLSPKKP